MSRRFKVLLEWDPQDSVWVTYVPALQHMSTFGETRDEALAMTREAILGYLEVAADEHLPIPTDEPAIELTEVEVATV